MLAPWRKSPGRRGRGGHRFPLVRTLEREGYDVTWVDPARRRSTTSQARHADVVILDLGLPDMDGLEVCRKARDAGYDGAIMIVTARAGELDRVVGLDYGADDYMPSRSAWPSSRPGCARCCGVPAAPPAADEPAIERRAAHRRGRPPGLLRRRRGPLTGKEFEVLNVLVANKDKVVSRDRLMADVWDENWYGSTKTLDVTIGRLRAEARERRGDREGRGGARRRVPPRGRPPMRERLTVAFVVLALVVLVRAGSVRCHDPARPAP